MKIISICTTKLPARLALIAGIAAFACTPAKALPAYAVKTGQICSACHIGGFGPQLTPFGRAFKLGGYTMDAGGDAFPVPVSAMVMSSFESSAKAQESPPAPHYSDNNNFSLDQASLFLAGGIGDHFGVFSQWTYDGIGRSFSWDNTDFRATDHVTLWGDDVLLGVSVNNNPGVQDAWNTLPAWGFPYTSSALAPAPAASTIFDGGLAQSVLGTTAYAWWNSSLYTEVGFYWTPSNRFLSAMGSSFGPGPISGVAPYVRVAYQKDYGDQNFEIGAFGFFPDLNPGGDTSTGMTDSYSDFGIDGSYQFMGDGNNIYTINARYTHESQNLAASQALGAATNLNDSLDDLRLDASYYWHNMIGGSVQLFNTWGSSDALLYASNSTFKPDSTGVLFQVDATPWGAGDSPFGPRINLRVGLQYIVYTKFDGASSNYDGTGRSASDNNTLRIFTWLAL
ncbi:MAG: cytochrome C [Alphaproteobacteria bacterium]|nr:cytochrome C [Alphaproteobacteria bacterium]MDE2630237.1 cytochrome C [Alphaproteobacteria bacterium]